MSALKVSVLINNYNYGRYLRQSIDSALLQSYRLMEVIVVDDGSNDNSREIIESYGQSIVSVFKGNGGQASAFNAGFAVASGDIVSFLDADDYYVPEAMAKIIAAWSPNTKILHHRLREVDEAGNPIGYYPALARSLAEGNVVPQLLAEGTYLAPTTSGLVYSRDLLQSIFPMPEEDFRLCADTYLFLVTPFFAPISVLDETLACYRFHRDNAYRDKATRFRMRRKLQMAQHYRDLRRGLLLDLARKHGYPSPDTRSWDQPSHQFDRLLLTRSSPSSSHRDSRKVAAGLLKQVWATLWPFFLGRLRMTFLLLIVTFFPRLLLRMLYPNIFCRNDSPVDSAS